MKKLFPLIVLLALAQMIFGQNNDDTFLLPPKDSILLKQFWTAFKLGIHTEDKAKLAAVCHFPFTCSPCIVDTTIAHRDPNFVKVTKDLFDKKLYAIFLEEKLLAFVDKYPLQPDLDIFRPVIDANRKATRYYFTYITVEENKQHPGRQIFVYLDKYHGQYKISATESIP